MRDSSGFIASFRRTFALGCRCCGDGQNLESEVAMRYRDEAGGALNALDSVAHETFGNVVGIVPHPTDELVVAT